MAMFQQLRSRAALLGFECYDLGQSKVSLQPPCRVQSPIRQNAACVVSALRFANRNPHTMAAVVPTYTVFRGERRLKVTVGSNRGVAKSWANVGVFLADYCIRFVHGWLAIVEYPCVVNEPMLCADHHPAFAVC